MKNLSNKIRKTHDFERIEESDVDFLTYSYNWEDYLSNLPLGNLNNKINKMPIRDERNIWFFVDRNADATRTSTLYAVSYPPPGVANVLENVSILFRHSFIEKDIVDASYVTKMYADPPIHVDIDKQEQAFQRWAKEKILTEEQVQSWSYVWRKMKIVQDFACDECTKLYRKKQQLHTRNYMKDQDDEDGNDHHDRLKQAIDQLKLHRQQCDNLFHISWFINSFDSLSPNHEEFDFDLLQPGLQNINTPFWKVIADYSKYSVESLKKMQDDVKNKICRTCDVEMKLENAMDDDTLSHFTQNPKWEVC